MLRFLDPKTDIAFKRIFGSEKNKDILIDFLNALLEKRDDEAIIDLEHINPTLPPAISVLKSSTVDILCKDKNGTRYIVEMQVIKQKGFEKRAQYYAAAAYCNQIKRGGDYEGLKEVIFLALTNYIMFPSKKAYKSDHVTLDKVTGENDLKAFSYTFVELPKFTKTLEQCTTDMDKWIYFMIHAEDTSGYDIERYQDNVIQRAYTELDQHYWTEEELEQYAGLQKQVMDAEAEIANARDEGLAKGFEKGKAEGLEIVAMNMLNMGMGINEIAIATGLTNEHIKNLQK